MKALKRILISSAGLIVLVAIFYAEEDWRGKRAWEKCKAELEAKGEVLDWDKYIPPPVPDDQNFFKAPNMTDWFVKARQNPITNDLTSRITDPRTGSVTSETNSIVTGADARSYLAWSDQFAPDFELIRDALKRPYARMDGDYSDPFDAPIPNFVAVRAVAQMLAQRAHCYLLLGQPEKALDELTLLNNSRRLLEGAPTHKPVTLVAAMIDVAAAGLYANAISGGLQSHAWQEPQLRVLQEQLEKINLLPIVAESFDEESAAGCHWAESFPFVKPKELFSSRIREPFWGKMKDFADNLIPHGWLYQNMTAIATLDGKAVDCLDLRDQTISPQKAENFLQGVKEQAAPSLPHNFLAAIVIPRLDLAAQTLAYNQTLANETQIACAVERYRLAHNEYPETLDALAPQFIEKLPHDIIGGQPLHYHRSPDGKFLLYSVGWNETDDDGQVALQKDGSVDREKGDWVWKN